MAAMKSTNWVNSADRSWWHRHNPKVMVVIEEVSKYDPDKGRGRKYRILHVHPAPNGAVKYQYPEYAETIKTAREKAKVHVRHWDNPSLWANDPDYGKGMDYLTFQHKGLLIPKSYCR